MSGPSNHYEVLGVSPLASAEEIRNGYQLRMQRLQRKMQEGNAPPASVLDAIIDAYATLRDPVQREAYDASLRNPNAAPSVSLTPSQTPIPPLTPIAAQTAAPQEQQEVRFEFHGSGGEYFRIWITNLLLSIVTFGFYSAWAKVRREQYFHRNLVLDGAGFDYHATPRAILIGRFIALALFFAVSAAQKAGPVPYLIVMLAAIGVVPWLILRAMRFRARNTSYRGLRFSFGGDYRGVLGAFVGYWFLTMVTMGILSPLWIRQMRLYVIKHLRYGNTEFSCEVPSKPFFRIIFMPGFVIVGMLALIVLLSFTGSMGKWLSVPVMFGIFFVYLAGFAYIRMGLNNLIWNHTALGEHQFSSSMNFKSYLFIVVKNWLLTALTLGFYWPWAKVNLATYRAENTGVAVLGGLEEFVAAAAEDVGAFGDEAAEMFDLDIAL